MQIEPSITDITNLIKECLEEKNMNRKIKIFFDVNNILPSYLRFKIPWLITNDYIDIELYKIENDIKNIIKK